MRVLISEDDDMPRKLLARVLKESGYEVVETVNGTEACGILQQPDPPKLMILDWMMPEMDGPEVLRRVRAQQTDRPPYIIMLTAKDEKDHIIAALAAGANDYLTKPFDSGELVVRVEVGERLVEMQLRQHEQRAHAQCARVDADLRMTELQEALAAKGEELRRALAEQYDLAARLLVVREEEREAIARELRESFGQYLAELQVDLMWVDRHLQTSMVPDRTMLDGKFTGMLRLIERLTDQIHKIRSSLYKGV